MERNDRRGGRGGRGGIDRTSESYLSHRQRQRDTNEKSAISSEDLSASVSTEADQLMCGTTGQRCCLNWEEVEG